MAALEETFERLTIENKLRAPLLSTADYAELALYLYKEHRQSLDADYEIVRALGSCRAFSYPYEHESLEVVDWCHVTFTAISRNSDCIDDSVLFFVELTDFSCGDQLTLNCFRISKPDAPGLTKGCRYCPPDEDHLHIPGAHFAGQWDYKPTNDTSQEEMAVRFQRQVIPKRKNKYFNPNFRRCLWPRPVKPDSSCFCPMLSDNEYASLALSNISRLEGVKYELVYTLYSHHVESVLGISLQEKH